MTALPEYCTYPYCKCIVATRTAAPAPICPHGLETPPGASYGIMAYRSAGSVCGAAAAWAKRQDKPMLFATEAEARFEAARLNSQTTSPNVNYSAQRFR